MAACGAAAAFAIGTARPVAAPPPHTIASRLQAVGAAARARNYPNAFDRRRGAADGRRRLGGDIMIHGRAASIGCLAMGDEVAEDLFVLAADTGLPRISVILAPWDLRRHPAPGRDVPLPAWAPELYASVAGALRRLPADRRP